MISIIIIIISIIIDLFLSSIIPMISQNLTLFTPMILISTIPLIIVLTPKKLKLIILVSIGIILDIFYSDYYLINIIFLILLSFINYKKEKAYLIISSILIFILYDIYLFTITNILGYHHTFNDLIYKIIHSAGLNIPYIIILILIFSRYLTDKKKLKY